MEKMQKYMDYIFFQVWMKAKYYDEFDLSLFNKNKDLKEIIFYFYYGDTSPSYGKKFVQIVMNIFEIFKSLNSYHLKLLKKWYISNNNIKEICRGKKKPIRYQDIFFNTDLRDELKSLYTVLYEQNYLGLKEIKNHYKDFCLENNKKICPFCGLSKMKCDLHSKREAYDHYLPQEKYPFNTINFLNLVPACHDCNSSYKLRKDPLFFNDILKRKAYYPYRKNHIPINISIEIDKHTNDVNINFDTPEFEEIETWQEIYGIQERYRAICDFSDEGGSWIEDVRIYVDGGKGGFDDYVEYTEHLFQQHSNPYHERRFLKVPFLKACKDAGII
ncbi:hypothetical protein [Sulfuricurvum sp. RIFCSPLOWO2_12_FULL_43_24]|uniref:HNH endonuclease n=1 Tax=Sulfuricurvum sp. RIFCSPLOWO2_12_FULL_43_24 TaxID=1802247 RepID=UPI0025D7119F|nr:hypothetical protein [Sulfuricurvum sp. RIFCSPLOWO2_12_FULL_43_24]